ncbi:MAG: isoprenyl transferase [Cyclobacteriaceae bacterium]|nr:isoprenyl transferase [Cyclobacteriaceae bacterium]
MEHLKEKILKGLLPRHIAVIMDGNGRWAKKKGAMRIFGHQNAIKAVRDISEGCAELGIEYLTLYAFSTENWGRPREEIEGLMQLLVKTIHGEMDTLQKNHIRLGAIGNLANLPSICQQELNDAIAKTSSNKGLNLILALSYSGRWDIVEGVRKVLKDVKSGQITPDELTMEIFSAYLSTKDVPDPELLIRTSGEMRISNFLLWQMAYTELYITDVLWPDFRKNHLYEALHSYQQRERRFGKLSEQVNLKE